MTRLSNAPRHTNVLSPSATEVFNIVPIVPVTKMKLSPHPNAHSLDVYRR
jgi:hypothetical protein